MNGVQVTQAWNGKEAVECFKKSEPYSFDAILMDMQMPEMDGCEAARRHPGACEGRTPRIFPSWR